MVRRQLGRIKGNKLSELRINGATMNKIHEYMNKRGMSTKDLSETTGLSRSQIEALKDGEADVTPIETHDIASVLETTPSRLFVRDGLYIFARERKKARKR
jgi:DNA-binding Xre family transcriptional regulator